MGSLKALQEWCRIQCENYNDVEIRDMSASFRDGLAFCAIIHRHRPDLIEFDSLSKENVYENNRLAFEVAEVELGIPALLDPEDMVSMKVPDRLSVITYVSQYYNFFNNKSQANPPSMKRVSTVSHNEPAQKRPPTPLEDKGVEPETGAEVAAAVKRSSLSSTCAACQKHVHLVQRFLIDGKLYHRNCFRCTECHSTLLPGSYKGNNSGALVCTHHVSRHASASQNGRPDLSKKPEEVQSARTGRSAAPFPALSERDEAKTPSPVRSTRTDTPADDSVATTAVVASKEESLGEEEDEPRPSSPPNPFDESDEEEGEIEEETQAEEASNGDLPPPSDSEAAEASRPVPAPRRVSEVTPPPRPAPRVRVSCTAAGEHLKPPTPPKPRERSQSPGSGTHKPKDPPWLALVQSETKRKKAPPPPPPGVATPPNSGSLSSLQAEGSGPGTPANPFEDEDDEVDEEEGSDGGTAPPGVAATHPWYSITQTPEGAGSEVTPRTGSSSRSASPGSAKSKKRPAPRVPPQPPTGNQAPSHSQPSSCSPSPALSIESLSSSSDHSSSQLPLGASSDQEQSFGKSVSEPSISLPGDNPSPSSSADLLSHSSQSSSPSALPPNASSAPATPQSSRNTGAKPPRPTTTPSPLTTQAHNKKFCKENPFNRKASPSNAKSETRPSKGPRPARPPAPGHGFPLIKRKVQSDQYIPVEDIHAELLQLEKQLDELEQRGVELEKKLRDTPNDEDEERLLVDWFTLIHDKHHLVRREAELVYTAKQQNLEERQADVEYELRCLLNKPEKDWTEEDKSREQELMAELVTIIEQRNQIVNSMDQERQREEEEDKLMEAMLKKKDFHKDPDSDHQKKKGTKFKPIKVLKRLSHKGDAGKSHSPRKDKS
ncbi:PREDICTED: MICAL-like protein 1 isoform X1 [Poecilia mexicana]|uniref:MICAL-like 1a n=1 Tax=Poecilia mexicana TaxID=48701 RepID=A0A3B3WY35_9TELE|nr:PREDICTED: MICAL-like protein 1 isoform X1 [Poecilia mexicana]XP_014864154.1 PREDICTED: MICAL-like protein 1 isoform X1 [Poecilia mexicana]XP_014864155.1 PREDICTED: MICAL-like protein 1 isoform X1 [Poecilia mexicana]